MSREEWFKLQKVKKSEQNVFSDHTCLHTDYKIVYDKKCKPVYHEKVILLILFYVIKGVY